MLILVSCSTEKPPLPKVELPMDYFFLIDTSGSMVGLPQGSGSAVIMPKVKNAIGEFIHELPLKSRVVVLPFDRSIHDRKDFMFDTEQSRQKTIEYVNRLEAKGQVTWIYYALREALELAQSFESPTQRKQSIMLYTDGLNNGPDDLTLNDIIDRFKLRRGENEFLFLYYNTLGVSLPLSEFDQLEKVDGIYVSEHPTGEVPPIIPPVVPPELTAGQRLKRLLIPILIGLLALMLIMILLCKLLSPKFTDSQRLRSADGSREYFLIEHQRFCRQKLTVGGVSCDLSFDGLTGTAFQIIACKGKICKLICLAQSIEIRSDGILNEILEKEEYDLKSNDVLKLEEAEITYTQ